MQNRAVIAKAGQSFFDLAVEHCGDVSYANTIAALCGMAVYDKPNIGLSIEVPIIQKKVTNHFLSIGLSPASYLSAPPAPISIVQIGVDNNILSQL